MMAGQWKGTYFKQGDQQGLFEEVTSELRGVI